MLRRRPALRVVILLAGGILLTEILVLPVRALWATSAILWLGSLVIFFFRPRSPAFTLLLHLTVFVFAVVWTGLRKDGIAAGRFDDEPDAPVELIAYLDEPPVRQGSSCRLILVADSIRRPGGRTTTGGKFLAFMPWKKADSIRFREAGTFLAIKGRLQEFPKARNPGEFDYGRYLSLNDIQGIVAIEQAGMLTGQGTISLRAWFAGLRSSFGRILTRHHEPEQAGFLQGVIFGDRREISPEMKEAFMNTGTTHILAVSGSNVALVALMLYLLLGLLRFPKRAIVLLTVIGLVLYMFITGASSSIVRATIMGCVIVIGTVMERRTDIYNSICVAAVIVLLIDPLQLHDVGFQLSFAAVLSIVSIYPRLERLIQLIPSRWEELKILDPVWKVFAVSLAAQTGTLPFTAYYFERISVVSLLANILVVPLVGLNLILGVITLVADSLGEWIADAYASLNGLLVDILLGFVQEAAAVPFAAVDTFGFGPVHSAIFYLALVAVLNLREPRVIKYCLIGFFVALNLGLYSRILRGPDSPRLVMLDVGQGDATLLRLTNGVHVLVDAGPAAFGYDAGKKVVVPFLRRHGIDRLEAVILSHPHSDHIGGLEAVLEAVDVGVIHEADTAVVSRMHSRLRMAAARHGVPVRTAGIGDDLSPDPNARLYVVHPGPSDRGAENINNASLCLKGIIGDATFFFAGDAEEEAESRMAARFGGFLTSDLLKAGHHGSSTSSSDGFLHGITPKIALISVGAKNKFGHPSPDVLRALRERAIISLRTDREGALIFETNGHSWTRQDWRK